MIMKKTNLLKTIMALILALNIVNVKALYINSYSGGNSEPVNLPDCDEFGTECGNFSQEFEVKVTLVRTENGEFHQVDGTETIHFIANNSDEPEYGYYYYNGFSDEISLENTSGSFEFVNSNVAKIYDGSSWIRADYFSGWQDFYMMYLGFNADYCNDFSCYTMNREDFIDFVTNPNTYESIYISEIGSSVSFIDFFLNKSGYTSDWHATKNADILKRIEEEGLTLLVEPVYTIYMDHNGYNYSIKGTIKQLAEVIVSTLNDQRPNNTWFWPANYGGNMFNAFCNFIDYSGNLYMDYNDRCSSIDYFSMDYPSLANTTNVCSNCNGLSGTALSECKKSCNNLRGRLTGNAGLKNNALDVYRKIADPDNAYGISVIDLSEIGEGTIQPSGPDIVNIENTCELEIRKCDSDWTFESKLTSTTGDIFHCVVPTDVTNIRESMQDYITHYETYDMWCYDDISYSFHDLKDEYNNKILKTNQVTLLPNARLKVNRTCYTGWSGVDMSVPMQTDDFTNEFTFNFLGKTYKYKKDGSRYQYNADGSKKTSGFNTSVEEITPIYENIKYYKHNVEFYYDYVVDAGTSSSTTKINILDKSISTSLGNNNSLYAYTGTKEGKIIKLPTSVDNTTNGYQSSSLNASNVNYGQNDKLYRVFKNNGTDTLYAGWGTSAEINNTIYQTMNTYKLKETNKTCEMSTTRVVDDRIDGGDILKDMGVQFRVISLSNPFPARDGSQRMPGKNWLDTNKNNVYKYITNNRNIQGEKAQMTSNVDPNEIYTSKPPLYTITLDPQTMAKIREYNKRHSYGQLDLKCEEGTGRACISNFLRNYINNLEGACAESDLQSRYIANKNNGTYISKQAINEVYKCLFYGGTKEKCNANSSYDINGDGKINQADVSAVRDDFYSCADKMPESGG